MNRRFISRAVACVSSWMAWLEGIVVGCRRQIGTCAGDHSANFLPRTVLQVADEGTCDVVVCHFKSDNYDVADHNCHNNHDRPYPQSV